MRAVESEARQPPADLVAVHPRKVAVEDDHVVVVQDGLVEAGQAVKSHIHGQALPPQAASHGVGESFFIFDDEDSHRTRIIAACV